MQDMEGTKPHPLVERLATSPKTTSLFDGLLGGRAEVLLQDALHDPTRYPEETRALLEMLATGGRTRESMTAEEGRLLDRAVVDFATYKPVMKPVDKPRKVRITAKKPAPMSEPVDSRAPTMDVPGGEMPAYWWV